MISLLTTYRKRSQHLVTLIKWLTRIREEEGFNDFELILIEGDTAQEAPSLCAGVSWIRYEFVYMDGAFHKSALLNRAAALASGQFLIPFDVDLLPLRGTLARHAALARSCDGALVAGYRIQFPQMLDPNLPLPSTSELLSNLKMDDKSLLGPEDVESSQLEYLLDKQRFGVCPCFPKSFFIELGGVDEAYVGWGAEDQDLIERACTGGLSLVRTHDLIYLHLPHSHERDWVNPEAVAKNKLRFRTKREQWTDMEQ